MLAGNEAQKKKYLGMLTSEPIFAAYAITEPAAGSDAAGIQSHPLQEGRRRLRPQRPEVLHHERAWATWYTVFATVDPALGHKGIIAFIVDRDTPGL
jgi:acyl-CoA dehydrogenase